MTLDQYNKLEEDTKRPFYCNGNGIIIPELHVSSFLVATCDQARSANRPCPPTEVRARFTVSPWKTDKTQEDGVWERFVIVTAGTGQKLSNQRSLRKSKYISNFDASGTFEFDPNFVKPETLKSAIEWGGAHVGIGASRKMGWGRFNLTRFEQQVD